jgi:hypothetical protein
MGFETEYLKEALVRAERTIEEYWAEVAPPYKDREYLGAFLWRISVSFVDRAIARFLVQGEVLEFVEDLGRSVLTELTLLRAKDAGYSVRQDQEGTGSSSFSPLVSALALGHFEMARELDQLLPGEPRRDDSLVSHWFAEALRALAAGEEARITAAAENLREAVALEGDEWEERIPDVVDALAKRDTESFASALSGYLGYFDGGIDTENMGPGEEFVSLEGLAFLRLARERGMDVSVSHRMIPDVLQNAPTVLPESGYPSWPE